MTALLGKETTGNSGALQAALRILSRDHGVEFKNLRKIGYVRLDDIGIIEMAAPDRQSIKKRVGRSIQRSANIQNWEGLADKYKREADTSRSILAVIRQATTIKTLNRVRKEVTKAHDELDLERTLALFQKSRKS